MSRSLRAVAAIVILVFPIASPVQRLSGGETATRPRTASLDGIRESSGLSKVLSALSPVASSLAWAQEELSGNEILAAILPDQDAIRKDFDATKKVDGKTYPLEELEFKTSSKKIGMAGEEVSVFLAAVRVAPVYAEGYGVESYDSRIYCAVLLKDGKRLRLRHFLRELPGVPTTGGQSNVDAIKCVSGAGRQFTAIEHSFSDSMSTPLGVHTITTLLDFDTDWKPNVAWSGETEYRYGGASQLRKEVSTSYEIADRNHDGVPELYLTATTVEEKALQWQDHRFAPATIIPIPPVQGSANAPGK